MADIAAHPPWLKNLHRHKEALRELREALMAGLKEGGRKAINMNKVTEILQKSDRSPAQFYERLCKKHTIYILPSVLRPLQISK
jgi:hypothetical protein